MAIEFNKFATMAGVLLLVLFGATDMAWAFTSTVNTNHPAFATVGNVPTSIPVGHAEFCRAHSGECGTNPKFVEAEILTDSKWRQLLAVNAEMNTSIAPVTDQDLYNTNEYWTYPAGSGDCEDYVLAKRRALIQDGWDASTLLIAVVKQANGEGHAVLMVRTDRGDLVLDNQASLVKLWNDTPYLYLKRQSQFNSAEWVDIYDNRPQLVASR